MSYLITRLHEKEQVVLNPEVRRRLDEVKNRLTNLRDSL